MIDLHQYISPILFHEEIKNQEEIARMVQVMELEQRWEKSISIPETRRFQQFKRSADNTEICAPVNSDHQGNRKQNYEINPNEVESNQMSDSVMVDSNIGSGEYILVEYAGKKSNRRFVGQVNEIKKGDETTEYNMLFLKRKDQEGLIFEFSDRMDISWITESRRGKTTAADVVWKRTI